MGFADFATLAEDDAFEAIVADDAGPEGVVEIEDEALGGAAAGGGEEACEVFAVERGGARVDLMFGAVPDGGIVPEGEAFSRRMRSRERRSTHSSAASCGRRRLISLRMAAGEDGMRSSLLPMIGGRTGMTVCWVIWQWKVERALRQQD